LDIILQEIGYRNIEPNAEHILTILKASKGFLPLTDKSDPQDVKDWLEMSKKSFKKAIGTLYKQRVIDIKEDGIYLITENEN
jgi:predicted RNA-binding protein (virulence factor B family)